MEELLAVDFEDTQSGRYLTFALGTEEFGIEIKFVTEIVGMQPIIALPETPSFLKGIMNLRGKIIPVIDIRLKFNKEEAEYTDRTCIIVIVANDVTVGLIVDSVSEVTSIEEQEISPPPSIGMGMGNRYMQGIGKVTGRIVLLLDCKKLFTDGESDFLLQL